MKTLMAVTMLVGMIPASLYAACANTASCPYCGETAALVNTSMDSSGHCVGTYSPTHQGNGARQGDSTRQHTFTITQ